MEGQPEKKRNRKFHVLLILIISGLLLLCIAGIISLLSLQKELKDIKLNQKEGRANQIKTNELLLSSMDWATRRQRSILFMRDMILDEWKRIGEEDIDVGKAYNYAELIMRNTENFPSLDPFLIMAIAWRESAFGERRVSFRGAIGVMQLMPHTARPYFELYGIPYSDSALYQPVNNFKVAIRLFADIVTSYNKIEKSLAIYNCGNYGIYYPDSMIWIPDETRKYVPDVLSKWVEYKIAFETFHVDSLLIKTTTIKMDSVLIRDDGPKIKPKKPRKKGRYAYRVEED